MPFLWNTPCLPWRQKAACKHPISSLFPEYAFQFLSEFCQVGLCFHHTRIQEAVAALNGLHLSACRLQPSRIFQKQTFLSLCAHWKNRNYPIRQTLRFLPAFFLPLPFLRFPPISYIRLRLASSAQCGSSTNRLFHLFLWMYLFQD